MRIATVVLALVVVFGWVIPSIIDYQTVWDSLKSLTLLDVVTLLGLTAARIVSEAFIYRAMLPGLGIWIGTQAYTSSSAVTVLPPPAPSIVQYAYFRSAGYDARASTTAAAGTFVFPQTGRLVLPLVALIALVIARRADGSTWLIAGAAVLVLAIAAVIVWLIGRSETSARWVGRQLTRLISWVLARFRRDPIADLGPAVVDFRDNVYDVVRRRWVFGSVAVAFNLGISFVMLLAALRFLGIGDSELPTIEVFAIFAAAFLAGTLIPLTAGGLGVVDLVLILGIEAVSDVNTSIIVAAVVAWRVFYDIVTMPVGVITLLRFTHRHPDLIDQARSDLGAAS